MAKCSVCGKDFISDCWLFKDEPKIEIIYRCPDCGADYKDKLIIEKNNKIKELEEKVEYYKNCYEGCVNNHKYITEGQKELSFNLYTALAETLEKQGLTDDIPSVIDQLVGKSCGKYADMYNEYKINKKELEDYKNAYRELCYYVEYEYPKKNDDIYYRKAQELEMIFLNKVKGEIK